MKKIVNPQETTRAQAFELWMKAPNPMVTFFKTLDVTRVNSCDITEIDGAVGMNSGIFNNPFIIWGRYRKKCFRYYLPISFQFHHTQMDGAHAGKFLQRLQDVIRKVG